MLAAGPILACGASTGRKERSRLLEIYSTFPLVRGRTPDDFCRPIATVARQTEAAGLRGLLIFTDNESPDPWLAAQYLLERTAGLVPLVAVQPLYMHPYTAARMVTTLGAMYGRRVDLNLVAGGYVPHLQALGCASGHDERYDRLLEYGEHLAALLGDNPSVTRRGEHYVLDDAVLTPRLPAGVEPRVFVAGVSPAAAAVAKSLGATRLMYPLHPRELGDDRSTFDSHGIRIGIIARDRSEQAWEIAHRRYPHEPDLEEFRALGVDEFDARWHDDIWTASEVRSRPDGAYWLHPFRITNEFCPFLVGDHAEVGEMLAHYLRLGIGTLILNQPREDDDLFHAMTAVRHAERLVNAEAR